MRSLIEWLDQSGGQSEDCLVLNICTPGAKTGGKRPVVVSIIPSTRERPTFSHVLPVIV